MPPLPKTCPKMVSAPQKGVALCEDVFAKKKFWLRERIPLSRSRLVFAAAAWSGHRSPCSSLAVFLTLMITSGGNEEPYLFLQRVIRKRRPQGKRTRVRLRFPTAEASPSIKNFFLQKRLHTTPFMGRTIFGQVFVRGGMSEIPKTKVPLRGPSASQMTFEGTDLGLGAARLCSLLRPSQTHRSLA